MKLRKKLIEVALPLEAINAASAREKSIRHGHPSTLHLWWARRPLAAARAVIFSQMVDDPSSVPELFVTEEAQEQERQRLFKLIEELVKWENTTNELVLNQAREEIWKSWRRACEDNKDHPRAKELFNPEKLPAFHDPFAGGGALPLEAQRLGLEAYASDLNPVAVLINKAMIEFPPKFAGMSPVNPESRKDKRLLEKKWYGAEGLAEDVRYYGKWMRDEAEKRIGHLYPKVEITAEMAKERPDLKPLVGQKLTVIAWLWARTVKSPNPAFADVDVPLASTFMLSTKPGKEACVEPVIERHSYRFTVKLGKPQDPEAAKNGTKLARANFRCVMSDSPISGDYIKAEGKAGRMGARLMAIVAEGERGRVYIAPTESHESVVKDAKPTWKPEGEIAARMTGGNCTPYGLTTWGDLFTPRQLVTLTTFSALIQEAYHLVQSDFKALAASNNRKQLRNPDANFYARCVVLYLAFALDKVADRGSSLGRWDPTPTQSGIINTFSRHALPMTWDFAESNPLGDASGSFRGGVDLVVKAVLLTPGSPHGSAIQSDACTQTVSIDKLVSTDPPYYDNIAYADLSDFFYTWLRRSLQTVFPEMFATLVVPKTEELVAAAYRHGTKEKAEEFFLTGMTHSMHRLTEQMHAGFPMTIYYAFKQSETESEKGISSTGWETFLDALIRAGFAMSGTWPMRTELGNRMIGSGTNALASSIILVCRKRAEDAAIATRREFVNALKGPTPDEQARLRAELKQEAVNAARREAIKRRLEENLPAAVAHLQRSNIAPVDLAQAAIGPGMAIYTRYSKVVDAEGKPLSVREALALINQTLDEVLAEQEGDFDADTRWALAWFEQSGFSDGEYGVAEMLSKAKVTSIDGLARAGILKSKAGKVRLLRPEELSTEWDPLTDPRLTVWEALHHLVRRLEEGGESAAAELAAVLGGMAETARELAYRLYTICERKKRAQEALSYNALVQSWPEISRLAREGVKPHAEQAAMFAQE